MCPGVHVVACTATSLGAGGDVGTGCVGNVDEGSTNIAVRTSNCGFCNVANALGSGTFTVSGVIHAPEPGAVLVVESVPGTGVFRAEEDRRGGEHQHHRGGGGVRQGHLALRLDDPPNLDEQGVVDRLLRRLPCGMGGIFTTPS